MMRHRSADDTVAGLTNRLGTQTSPYLLQHRGNPVPWQPWDERALEAARRLDRPILLSVGYATCYWCHVMERESFEDAAIGALLGETVVPIKLDREQRPDLDDIYMTATQLLTRHGGWPMNVFLTPPGARGEDDPGLEPFYAGTYFPPKPARGMPSFRQVVEGLATAWRGKRSEILEQAAMVTEALRRHLERPPEPERLDESTVGAAVDVLLRTHDATNGGFGHAPKFPTPTNAELLLDAGPWIEESEHRSSAHGAVRATLDAMAIGGLHDHLAGGFHRYCVDATWTVPHFEKMLYDNGRLATLYARAYRQSRDALDLAVAQRTCDWALDEMLHAGSGLFSSAIDAEVHAREGLNYLWTREEIGELELDDGDTRFAIAVFGLDAEPNFRDPHHPEDGPKFVLNLADRPDALAKRMGLSAEEFEAVFERVRGVMLGVRRQRDAPITDDKVITSWNALMIEGLAATAGASPGAARSAVYLDAAERALDGVFERMRDGGGTLLRSARGGVADPTPAFAEDASFLLAACIAAHHAAGLLNRGKALHLERARGLASYIEERFGSGPHGAAMLDADRSTPGLLARARSASDGAMPSAVGVYVNALHDLHQLTNERGYHERAVAALGAVSASVREQPAAHAGLVRGLLRLMQTDGSVPEKLGPVAPEGTPNPVAISATQRTVELAPGTALSVPLRIEIGEGFHINAQDAGPAGDAFDLVPLSVRVEGSGSVSASLETPEAETLRPGFLPEADSDEPAVPALRVHASTVDATLTLERAEGELGSPTVVVAYQVCSDTACYRPISVALDLRITG